MSSSSESHGTHDLNAPTMTTNLSGLIEQLRAAKEGSATLDLAIDDVLDQPVWGAGYRAAYRYTTDLSAIVALVEKLLPSRAVAFGLSSNPSPFCGIAPSTLVNAPTLPLACCIALLLALQSEVSNV